MGKITRVRTGCWTCKARHRKCDEGKPFCQNCVKGKRKCEGYGIRLSFDVDDGKKKSYARNNKGRMAMNADELDTKITEIETQTFEDPMTQSRNSDVNSITVDVELQAPDLQANNMKMDPKDNNNGTLTSSNSTTASRYQAPNIQGDILEFDQMKSKITSASMDSSTTTKNHIPDFQDTDLKFDHTELKNNNPITCSPAFSHVSLKPALTELENALHDGLDYLLNQGSVSVFNSQMDHSIYSIDVPQSTETAARTTMFLESETNHQTSKRSNYESSSINDELNDNIINFIDTTNLYTNTTSVSYSEENMMLKHFFNKLLPLLDAHPNSPWPELALKYCDFEIARSCFISLSCMHLYESKGGSEYYKRGMHHINNTMDYLIKYVKGNPRNQSKPLDEESSKHGEYPNTYSDINLKRIVGDLKEETIKKKQSSFFVIILLIHVHLLFGVLESGRSALSRIFLKLFSYIAEDPIFVQVLKNIDQSQTLICVLSWYDTITAVISPDCRLPYCNPDWYGTKTDIVSTSRMMGCPGEIFKCMFNLCKFKRDIKYNSKKRNQILEIYEIIKSDILDYRNYVALEGEDYYLRLQGAQCWALSVYLELLNSAKPNDYKFLIRTTVSEFIHVYGSMSPTSPIVTQMVWPVFNFACEATTTFEKEKMQTYMETLYRNAKMGTLMTLQNIVQEIWTSDKTREDILSEWLKFGIDYLPL